MAKKITGLHQAAGAGRQGQSVAADRAGARSARPEHHGILQAVQRARPRRWKPGMPIPVVITVFQRPHLHVRHQDAAGQLLPEEGGRASRRAPRRSVREIVGKVTKAQVREIAETEDGRPQRQRRRGGDGPGRRARPARWASRWWSRAMARRASDYKTASGTVDREKHLRRSTRRSKIVKAQRQGEVRRDHRDRDEPRHRSAPRRPDGARRGRAAERHRQVGARGGVRPRRQGRGSQGRRRRSRRCRGPGREDPGRRDRVRPLHRHAGHDGRGRPAR